MICNKRIGRKKTVKLILCVFLFLFFCNVLFAQDNNEWTIGAIEFTYTQDVERSEYEKSILKAVPKLILDQVTGLKERNIPNEEIVNRELDKLIKERLSFFLELSKETKLRDSYVLQELSKYQFDKKTKISEEKILDIQKKIDDNLEKQEKILNENSKIKKAENFVVYNNNSDNLFEITDKQINQDFFSYQFSSEVIKANINGLITGTILTYGNYCAVSAQMIVYPGAIPCAIITEVGNISKIDVIAKNIAYRLIPQIENAIPCEVQIKFVNENLRNMATLTVDSTVYSKIPEKIILSSGVHNLCFECSGYRKESFSYGFGYEKKYIIEIEFIPEQPINIALDLKKEINGSLFYNAKPAQNNIVAVKINNTSVLGYYLTKNDNNLMFMIKPSLLLDNTSVNLNLRDKDIGANIEKKRKMMYTSYSALICSLPLLFYSYANYNNLYRSYLSGNRNFDIQELRTYQTLSYVGIGLSVSLGGWFVFELIRYLFAANQALPAEPKKSNLDFDTSVATFENMILMFKQMEEEELLRQKAEEEALEESVSKNDEQSDNLQEFAEQNLGKNINEEE